MRIEDLTYYDVLEVAEDASMSDIRQAYLKLAAEHHPDRFADDEQAQDQATENFQTISESYEVLIDPSQRKEYDLKLARVRAHTPASPAPGSPRAFSVPKVQFPISPPVFPLRPPPPMMPMPPPSALYNPFVPPQMLGFPAGYARHTGPGPVGMEPLMMGFGLGVIPGQIYSIGDVGVPFVPGLGAGLNPFMRIANPPSNDIVTGILRRESLFRMHQMRALRSINPYVGPQLVYQGGTRPPRPMPPKAPSVFNGGSVVGGPAGGFDPRMVPGRGFTPQPGPIMHHQPMHPPMGA